MYVPVLISNYFLYCLFAINFEIWMSKSSSLFSLKLVLAILNPVQFYTNFRMIL